MNRWFLAGALELVLIVGRHGIRSPLQTNQVLAPYAAEAWPQWSVPPAILTPKGGGMERSLGSYFRARYLAAGLLTGDAAADSSRIFLRSDSDQRTIASAQILGEALAPGHPPRVLTRGENLPDPLFAPVRLRVGNPDPALGAAAILGRMGGDPAGLIGAHRVAFAHLQRVLFGGDAMIPGRQALLGLPSHVIASNYPSDLMDWSGPFHLGMNVTEALLLQYEEGMPVVGWGRVGPADLQEFLTIHSLYFNLAHGTFYCAQVEGSNLATHLRETLEQAATGRAVRGAVGPPGKLLVVLIGHDSNLITLGGLLNLSWTIPGTAGNPTLPSGALVFEMRRGANGGHVVRLEYVSPTLDQLRRGDALSPEHPPAVAPIFIPGCSTVAEGYEAPLQSLLAKLAVVADPRFTVEGAD